MKKNHATIVGAALLAGAVATTALAGGPNSMFDPVNKVPYRWNLDEYPNQSVPVYNDLGGLGLLNNAQTTEWVRQALAQWNDVPTSRYRAEIVGDVTMLPGVTGDITPANVAQVYPKFNGGGITVVYDHDGKIFRDYLGLGQSQILGIAYPEYIDDDTNEIFEATVFVNGFMQWANDTDGSNLAGVFTHELGHAANLAHTQGNGAVYNTAVRDYPRPYGCPTGPYAGGENSGPARDQIETMYPFLDNRITGTAKGQFTVDKTDDIAAISDLYPEPTSGWPESHGTIKGTIKSLTRILGNGTGPERQATGVNVIARNVANPYNDFNSAVSGGLTRGHVAEDGSFEIHGLTPGAQYVLYVDGLAAGAFPYPRTIALPGPEEWYNASESGNGETDDRCAWTPITVQDHAVHTADITFNRVKGAPSVTYMNFNGITQGMTPDGSVMVGDGPANGSYWMWSETEGYQEIGGMAAVGGTVAISDDGSKVAGAVKDADGVVKWGRWDRATRTWEIVPTPTGGVCLALTPAGNFLSTGTVWGISGDGSTVVGSTYNDGPNSCRRSLATKWTAAEGAQLLPKYPVAGTNPQSRANRVSYDGSVIAGFDHITNRNGAYWVNGALHLVGTASGPGFVGEATDVTRDGSTVTGLNSNSGNPPTGGGAYKHDTTNDAREVVGVAPPSGSAVAYRTNDAGTVISGYSRLGAETVPRIWTAGIGWADLNLFLNAQGIFAPGTLFSFASALSADGTIWGGRSASSFGNVPWRIEIPKAIVCHKSPGSNDTTPHNLDVEFPEGLDDHLAHGDTLGLCQHGGE